MKEKRLVPLLENRKNLIYFSRQFGRKIPTRYPAYLSYAIQRSMIGKANF